jgi:D-alanyl-D-alanine dipeptidase
MCRACLFLWFSLSLTACKEGEASKKTHKNQIKPQYFKGINVHQINNSLDTNLTDVQSLNAQIQIELRYTGPHNFLGERLYRKINRAYLQRDVAKRLVRVQQSLHKAFPGYKLLVYDALRPVTVQQKMWEALDSLPPVERAKFVSNPKNLSLHNMGAAIDLTIQDDKGKPLDMGAGFDDIRLIAYPIYEDSFLRTGVLSPQQVANRKLLRTLMKEQGFRQLPTEWWHYNACSRDEAKKMYKVYQTEDQIFYNQ